MPDLLIGIEMKPSSSALVLGPAVPGERQRLDAAVGKFDQILLEGKNAEGVFDLELGELPVRPVGLDHELAVAAEEARLDPVMVESRAGKVTQHRLFRRMVHGELVVRAAPEFCLVLMAGGAGLAADIACFGRSRGGGAGLRRDPCANRCERDDDAEPEGQTAQSQTAVSLAMRRAALMASAIRLGQGCGRSPSLAGEKRPAMSGLVQHRHRERRRSDPDFPPPPERPEIERRLWLLGTWRRRKRNRWIAALRSR